MVACQRTMNGRKEFINLFECQLDNLSFVVARRTGQVD